MFEVLTFVYENFDVDQSYLEPAQLQRKLKGVGFAQEEIEEALAWLQGLGRAAYSPQLPLAMQSEASVPDAATPDMVAALPPSSSSSRIYPPHEQRHLGVQALGFLTFLESVGQLPSHLREVVIERALAAPAEPLPLDDLKIIVLMVYWRFGHEPDALVLDELCDSSTERVMH